MAELNRIRFLLFISSMIFTARALDVILSGAHQHFKQKYEIKFDIIDGEKIYRETLNELAYEARKGTSKVIVYIISRSRCVEILRTAVSETRSQIAQELRQSDCELVFLGIEHLDNDEYHLIGAFIVEKIQPHPDQPDIIIETIGENRFDQFYRCHVRDFEKYQENAHICGGTLSARLRSIPRGSLRPVGNNSKEIKFYGYHPVAKEWRWSVSVENNKYFPNVSISDPIYNFVLKNQRKKICLLIISGKEYSAITSYGSRRLQRVAVKTILDRMTKKKEVLIILGVFNFDWTEIDIVTQIILKHSEGLRRSDYNVFTCGYGMFNTYYRNVYEGDGRDIRQQPNAIVSEVIKVLMGGEVKERAIKVYYYDYEWKSLTISINLSNGRYAPERRLKNFTLPCRYQNIAFIVYDRVEMNIPIDYSVVTQCLGELERSEIGVVFIEAINFGPDDVHIIAEWIDHHSRVINLEKIAVLGGGLFDTIFQSEFTTYNTFLNTNKNELETIRNVYVKIGNGKSVSVANIDEYDGEFEVWSYSMNTVVNGCYEPDLIPDQNMFNNTGEKKLYFIITSADTFKQISAMKDLSNLTTWFRLNINKRYPNGKWCMFLVGLDNFEERDSHLFAELVRRQTRDGRYFGQFVRTLNYGTSQTIYQYKDTTPFDDESSCSYLHERFTYYFGRRMQTVDSNMTLISTDTDA